MSLTFAIELLRRYFGADVYNRGGMVDLRFLRPVRPGDSVTFTGKITGIAKEANGGRVSVAVTATNQKGDVTAAGTGACLVPSGYLPSEEKAGDPRGPPNPGFWRGGRRLAYCSILMLASLMILAYFATSALINAVTSSGFDTKASDPCLIR